MVLIQQASLQTETDIDAIAIVTEWFQQFQYPPLSQTHWMEAQLALIEGFTNAVLHAHNQLAQQTPIELNAQLCTDCFQFSIWDYGVAYDFEATLQRLQHLTDDVNFVPQEREAHWGSILLLKLRNECNWQISYVRQPDNRNRLFVRKEFAVALKNVQP
jgi:serine/threonine-protein kinase RsbW